MAEGILKYSLPEEEEEFKTAKDGGAWKAVVWEVDQKLRNILKHEGRSSEVQKALQEIRDFLHSEATANNLNVL